MNVIYMKWKLCNIVLPTNDKTKLYNIDPMFQSTVHEIKPSLTSSITQKSIVFIMSFV